MVNVVKCYWIVIVFLLTMAINIYSKEEGTDIVQITTVISRTSECYEEMLNAKDANPIQDIEEATVEYEDISIHKGTMQRQEREAISEYIGRPNDKETGIGEVTSLTSKVKRGTDTKEAGATQTNGPMLNEKESTDEGTVSKKMQLENPEREQTSNNLEETEGHKVTGVAPDKVTVTEEYRIVKETSDNLIEADKHEEKKETSNNVTETGYYYEMQETSTYVTGSAEYYEEIEETFNNVTEMEKDEGASKYETKTTSDYKGNKVTDENTDIHETMPKQRESTITNETERSKEESNSKDGGEFKNNKQTSSTSSSTTLLTETPQYAKLSQFPWIVVFRASPLNQFKLGDTLCTGTLIEEMWVLTVAHCFHPNDNASSYKVFAGIIEVPAADKEEITKFYQERVVSDIIVHPRFFFEDLKEFEKLNSANGIINTETTNYLYDLALMRLQTPFSDNTKVIIRPLRMSSPIAQLEQEHCVIVAWERFQKQDTDKTRSEVRLQWKRVWLDDGKVCERRYKQTLVNIMCVGSDVGNKTCYGPGGSPLVCRVANKDRMVKLLGISLWIKITVGCSDIFPQYMWVEGYENWMGKVMRSPYRSLSSFRGLSVQRHFYNNAGLCLCVDKALVLAALAACALYSISWTEILGSNRSHIPQVSWSHHDCFHYIT